jgi:hypothetical protein
MHVDSFQAIKFLLKLFLLFSIQKQKTIFRSNSWTKEYGGRSHCRIFTPQNLSLDWLIIFQFTVFLFLLSNFKCKNPILEAILRILSQSRVPIVTHFISIFHILLKPFHFNVFQLQLLVFATFVYRLLSWDKIIQLG